MTSTLISSVFSVVTSKGVMAGVRQLFELSLYLHTQSVSRKVATLSTLVLKGKISCIIGIAPWVNACHPPPKNEDFQCFGFPSQFLLH